MSELVHRPAVDDGQTAETPVPTRERWLVAYLVLSALLLVPGVVATTALRQFVDETTTAGRIFAAFDREMQRIAFGSTPRFWMGVAGATCMGLLLLYPLRKMFGFLRWISVGSWFHLHVGLGLAGPILIAYHCYFGTGSTPANVALFTTIAVTVSGIFGHYVHTRISAGVHGRRRDARSYLDDARNDIAAASPTTARSRLLDDLGQYEQSAKAVTTGFLARWRLARTQREMRRDLMQRAADLMRAEAQAQRWEPERTRQAVRRVQHNLGAYFSGLGIAARHGVWERISGRWRMLHLPLFLVTVAAASIHVYNVWGMDDTPANPTTLEADAGGTAAPDAPDDPVIKNSATLSAGDAARATLEASPASPITTHRVQTRSERLAPPPAAKPQLVIAPTMLREGQKEQVAEAPKSPARHATASPLPPETPHSGEARVVAAAGIESEAKADTPPHPAAPPKPVAPAARAKPVRPAVAAPKKPVEARAPAPELASEPAAPPPAKVASTPPQPMPPPPMAAGARDADPVGQLAQATATTTTKPDNTGRLDPASMRERLRALKADRTFNHDQTRFPLTGQHRRVACESCHKTTLKDTSRRCISCHRKDDVHRGRRPNCESCHSTSNWRRR